MINSCNVYKLLYNIKVAGILYWVKGDLFNK